jgi:hypothetical protein
MKRLGIVGLALLLAVLACTNPPPDDDILDRTPTVYVEPTATTQATEVGEVNTNTPVPSVEPTATATPRPNVLGGELYRNGGFESFCVEQEQTENPDDYAFLHYVPCQTRIWYAGVNYLDNPVPALYAGTRNPADLVFGRPEAKETTIVRPSAEQCSDPVRSHEVDLACDHYRVNSGNRAAQLFWYSRPGQGGLQQEIWLPSRDFVTQCTFSVYMQPWISDGTDGLYSTPSQLDATDDDKLALHFDLYINDGLMLRDGTGAIAHKGFGFDDIVFDDYDKYTLTFTLPTDVDRIFATFGVTTAYPWPNQDFYFDDVSLRCNNLNFEPEPDYTPTPISNNNGATSVAPIVTPMYQPNPYVVNATYLPTTARNIRRYPLVHSSTYTGELLNAGESVKIYLRYDDPYSDDFWGCLNRNYDYTCTGGYICTATCNEWVAIVYEGLLTGTYTEIDVDG